MGNNDKNNKDSKIILLFDNYNDGSKDLHSSYKSAGYNYPAVCVNTDGYLPDDVISPYDYFIGKFETDNDISRPISTKVLGRPRYFNQIKVPEYWRIESDNRLGKVIYHGKERAKIYYINPGNKRLITIVDWIDENGKVRCCEHYNKHGAMFARSIANKEGKVVSKTYFNSIGEEVIEENYITGTVILTYKHQIRVFRSKIEFILFGLYELGYLNYTYYYNSLSVPFIVSQSVTNRDKNDILFWQESINGEIPGNMKLILDGNSNTSKIYVQNKVTYENLIKLGASNSIVMQKGFVYNFVRDNRYTRNALICTNSDDIPEIEKLITSIPNIHFSIAAITKMSDKLTSLSKYKNVSLYPNMSFDIYDKLLDENDIYLDINKGDVLLEAPKKAFLNNQVLFGFKETVHNPEYCASIYEIDKVDKLIEDLKNTIKYESVLSAHITLQYITALVEDKELY